MSTLKMANNNKLFLHKNSLT